MPAVWVSPDNASGSYAGFSIPPSAPCMQLSQHTALQRLTFLSRDYSVVRHSVDFIEIAELHLLLTPIAIVNGSRRFLFSRSVNLLASFPMWPAFPTSEYYDVSDALDGHRQTACLIIPSRASHVHIDGLYEGV